MIHGWRTSRTWKQIIVQWNCSAHLRTRLGASTATAYTAEHSSSRWTGTGAGAIDHISYVYVAKSAWRIKHQQFAAQRNISLNVIGILLLYLTHARLRRWSSNVNARWHLILFAVALPTNYISLKQPIILRRARLCGLACKHTHTDRTNIYIWVLNVSIKFNYIVWLFLWPESGFPVLAATLQRYEQNLIRDESVHRAALKRSTICKTLSAAVPPTQHEFSNSCVNARSYGRPLYAEPHERYICSHLKFS